MPLVSNLEDDGGVAPESSLRVQQLRASRLWHTDGTFLPWPALANILAARRLPASGGENEFVSTRAAWRGLPEAAKRRTRNAVLRHRHAHTRMAVSPAAARRDIVTMWPDTAWRSTSPRTPSPWSAWTTGRAGS